MSPFAPRKNASSGEKGRLSRSERRHSLICRSLRRLGRANEGVCVRAGHRTHAFVVLREQMVGHVGAAVEIEVHGELEQLLTGERSRVERSPARRPRRPTSVAARG